MITNELAALTESIGLDASRRAAIIQEFKPFESIAAEWEMKAHTIVVTDEDDTETMEIARDARLELRRKRIEIENKRKSLKEGALQETKLIDGIARILKGTIEPIELHLLTQEKYAETKAAERQDALLAKRKIILDDLGCDSSIYDLVGMTDDQFIGVVDNATAGKFRRAEAEAAQKAEAEQQVLIATREREARAAKEQIERAERDAEIIRIKEEQRIARIAQDKIDASRRKEVAALKAKVTKAQNKLTSKSVSKADEIMAYLAEEFHLVEGTHYDIIKHEIQTILNK